MAEIPKMKRCCRCNRLMNFVLDNHACEDCNNLLILIDGMSRSGINFFYRIIQRRWMDGGK